MNRKYRIELLKKLAQTTTTVPATAPSTNTTQSATQQQQTINIRSIPNFNAILFSTRPDIITNIDAIVNVINQYLLTLTNNDVSFSIVWTNPSISGSEYSNSTKNLINIAKWIYNVVKLNGRPYTIEGLKQIADGLIKTVNSYSFPESSTADLQSKLVNLAQLMLAKLGGR
jgi:hypothetical protein